MYTLDICLQDLNSRLHLEFFKNKVEQLLYQRYRLYRFLLSVIYIYTHNSHMYMHNSSILTKTSALKIISGTILWLKAL